MGLLDDDEILQDSHINRDHSGIIFNHWVIVAGLSLSQFAQLTELGETPVRGFGSELVL
jgi:hypothetical protein